MQQLILEPFITWGHVKSWRALDFLYHLRWALREDQFSQSVIENMIMNTGSKVYFPWFDDEWVELIPHFQEEPVDLSVITID